MQGGGEISIELRPYVSPTNTWRFFRLVGEGHFDGLTFHRWAPNFVIQGGSPNANEFYGDAAFSRDEVGPHHWRGTVGISTRGHDTGDGQIFVNLMDNVRLDHTYTIVGTVVEGLDVVDRVFEGGVIERAEVRESR
jgi:cyclophilin family peptidyl-prolyl cis-trans isomerase